MVTEQLVSRRVQFTTQASLDVSKAKVGDVVEIKGQIFTIEDEIQVDDEPSTSHLCTSTKPKPASQSTATKQPPTTDTLEPASITVRVNSATLAPPANLQVKVNNLGSGSTQPRPLVRIVEQNSAIAPQRVVHLAA